MSAFLIEYGIHINFHDICNKKCFLHFMTHIDTDRVDLTIPDNVKHIYTSEFNAWVLKHKYKVDPKRIVSLPTELTLNFVDKVVNLNFNVTLFNANHSPGSVMFLFESNTFGTVLYTGKFCYKHSMFDSKIFTNVLAQKSLSCLCLDVTSLRFRRELPTKRNAIQNVVNLIKSFPDHKICIFLKDLIDNVLNDIAKKIKEPVYVNDFKMKMLEILKLEEGFTTDPLKARVYGLTLDADDVIQLMKNNLKNNTPVLKILLSTSLYPSSNMEEMQNKGVHLFSYRTHSSQEELKLIINKLKPKEVLPILSADTGILHNFLQLINYESTTNSNISNDFWKHVRNLDKLLSSTPFRNVKYLNLNKTITSSKNSIKSNSCDIESSTLSGKRRLRRNKHLIKNNLNCVKKRSDINKLSVNCHKYSSTNNNQLNYFTVSISRDTGNRLISDKKAIKEKNSNCNSIFHEHEIKNDSINRSLNRNQNKCGHDLKKTLINLKYKVEVCNILESVNFLQTLGLRPTWNNKELYKSPIKLTKLIRESRRKPNQIQQLG